MPIDLRAKMSGGGSFQPATSSGYQTIPTGSSGDVLVLSNANNKDVRLDSLSSLISGQAPNGERDITVNVDGVDLASGILAGLAPQASGIGGFAVQQTGAFSGSENTTSNNTQNAGYISDVVGKVITVTKNSSSTSGIIAYSSSVGK